MVLDLAGIASIKLQFFVFFFLTSQIPNRHSKDVGFFFDKVYSEKDDQAWDFPDKWGSLHTQWLRLHAPDTGGPGSIPGQGTRSHVPQLKIPHASMKTEDLACCN